MKLRRPLLGRYRRFPIAYQWTEGKLGPHPTEASIRKFMYELFQKHRRKKTVARLLNERGYRTRKGSPFTDTTVDRLLRCTLAKGIRRSNYTQTKDGKKSWEYKPESEWVLHDVEAIVPGALWDECNALLDAHKLKGKHLARQVVHLFSGIVHCGCGQKMYVPSNTPKYVCYQCRNKIPVVDLEAVFQDQVRNFFFSPQEIAAELGKGNAVLREKEELLFVLDKEQKKLVAERDKLYDLYQSGAIDKQGFGAKYHPLALRQRQLEDEIPQVQAELDVLKISHLSHEEIIADARDLYTRWPELPQEEKRRIVEAITDRIIVHEGEVEIHLFYAPTSVPSASPGILPTSLNGDEMATRSQRRVAFLPYLPITLKALKPKETDFEPKTLGEHIKKRRLELKLTQTQASDQLGINSWTLLNWEKGKTTPPIPYLPAIHRFLGYDPFPPTTTTVAERLIAKRRQEGWTQKHCAKVLGVDSTTLGDWERGETVLFRRHRIRVAQFLGIPEEEVETVMGERWGRGHRRMGRSE